MNFTFEISGLVKKYPGFLLDNVELNLPTGYVMGLVGPNGAGKTTLVKILLNAVHKDSGTVKVFGLDHVTHEATVKSRIGFVHESPPYYEHFTAKRFGSLVALFYDTWSMETFNRLLGEFDLPPAKKIREYSRGMKMKLALAIALSHHADLLVLDEPTTGLDPVFRRELLDRLRDVLVDESKSILFSTHITSDLERIADYVAYIRDGRISLVGDITTLKESWRLVKGGTNQLTSSLMAHCTGWKRHEFGFTALTNNVDKVLAVAGSPLVVEEPTLDDVVFYFDRGYQDDTARNP